MDLRRRALLAISYAFLLIPLAVVPYNIYPFSTGKTVVLRILAGIGLMLIAWRLPPRNRIVWWTAAYIVAMGIATLAAPYPDLAFWSSPLRQEGYANILAFFVLFLVLVEAQPHWPTYFAVAVGVAVVDALVGIGGHFVYVATQQLVPPKVHSLTGNASYLALYLAMALILVLWLWTGAREREGAQPWSQFGDNHAPVTLWPWPIPTRKQAWGMLLAGALILWCFNMTQSRGALLALAVGLFYGWTQLPGWTPRRMLVVAALIAGGAILLGLSTLPWNSVSIYQRLELWRVAVPVILERPITGWGPDGFFQGFLKHVAPESSIRELPFDRAHNFVLDRLASGGILGLVTYLGLIWAMWRTGIDPLPRVLLLVYLTGNLFLFDVMETSILFWALASYLVSRDVAQHAAVVPDRQPPLYRGV